MARREPHSSTEPETTGHEWDGITELNKPLPKWWLWTFYATIVWSIGYWLLMPSWPLVSTYTKGLLRTDQWQAVEKNLVDAAAERSAWVEAIENAGFDEIRANEQLMQVVLSTGPQLFGE